MSNNRILATIFFIIFLDLLGVGIIIPILPALFEHERAHPLLFLGNAISPAVKYIFYGVLIALYSIGRFFAAPILGDLSDVYGRKKILIFSLIGTAFGYFLFAYGIWKQALELLFLSRLADGVTGGNISTAQAVIGDVSKPEDRAKNFGMIGAAFGLGFILGPFLGGILSDHSVVTWFNPKVPFIFAGILSLLSMLMTLIFLPETAPRAETAFTFNIKKPIQHIGKALRDPHLGRLFVVSFLFTVGFGFYTSFFALYLSHKFFLTEKSIGLFFAYSGIFIAFMQLFVTRHVAKKYPDTTVLGVSFLMIAFSVSLYASVSKVWMLYLLPPFAALWIGLTLANFMSLLSKRAGDRAQGEVFGLNASMQSAGEIIPPLIAGIFATKFSPVAPLFMSVFTLFLTHVVIQKELEK